jgi:hypothetical protein
MFTFMGGTASVPSLESFGFVTKKMGRRGRVPPKPWRRRKPSLPKLNDCPSASFDQFLTPLSLAPIYQGVAIS